MEYKEDFNMELKNLSPQFYTDYNQTKCPQILYKDKRAYSCFIINCKDYTICIPYRSNIKKDNAFLFQNTERSKKSRSGLDYEKMVIVKDTDKYLDNSKPIVDNDEYVETIINCEEIVENALTYIDRYKKHITGEEPLHPKRFAREYGYTALQYFHEELEIDLNKNVNIDDADKNTNKDANKDKGVDNNSDKEYNISSNNEEKNNENNSKSPLPENKASKEELEDKQFFDTANMINNTYGNIKTVAEKANIALNNIKNNPPEHTENHKGNNITNNLSTSEDDKYDEPD